MLALRDLQAPQGHLALQGRLGRRDRQGLPGLGLQERQGREEQVRLVQQAPQAPLVQLEPQDRQALALALRDPRDRQVVGQRAEPDQQVQPGLPVAVPLGQQGLRAALVLRGLRVAVLQERRVRWDPPDQSEQLDLRERLGRQDRVAGLHT